MGWAELFDGLEQRDPVPAGPIPNGRRNDTLTRIAGALRRQNASEETLLVTLRSENKRCETPLGDDELRRIAHSVARYEPEPPHLRIAAATNGTVAGETVVETMAGNPWPDALGEAAYHGVLGELVRAVEGETEADPVGLLGGLLVHVATLAGPWRVMHQGAWQAARLFVVQVGDTATSRKGTSRSVVSDIVRLVEPEYYKLLVPGLGSGEGLIGHLKRLRADGGDEQRALIVESELGRLLGVMGREGQTLSPVLRDAWDGVPMGRHLARDGTTIHEHHVCLFADVTPTELRSRLSDTDAANGFGNRFLWLAVRRPRLVAIPDRIDGLVAGRWAKLARALAHARGARVLQWTPAAETAWRAFYAEVAAHPRVGLLGALTARGEAQVTRLALTYALADGADDVDTTHLEAGMAVWRYAEQSARYIFGDSTGNRHADVLRRWLQRDSDIAWATAKQELGMRNAADMEEVVGVLTSAGIAEVAYGEPPQRGGRRPRVIRAKGAKGANSAGAAHPRGQENHA